MKRVIEKAIKLFGPEMLLSPDRFINLIEDLKPISASERKFLKAIYTKPIAQLLYDGYMQNRNKKQIEIGKLFDDICKNEETHFSDVYKRLYHDIYGTMPTTLPNYKDVQSGHSMVSPGAIRKLTDSISSKKINETFFLGRYVQSVNGTDTPIEWIVVKKEHKKIMAVSKYALFSKPYNIEWNSTSWQQSSLREYLNKVFFAESFSDVEKHVICDTEVNADENSKYEGVNQGKNTTDKVFLLSAKEVEEISASVRICEPSPAIGDKVRTSEDGKCRWWLRTLGYDTDCATGVYADGKIDKAGFSVNSDDAVRPAICIIT